MNLDYNKTLLELNRRYQELFYSKGNQKELRKQKYKKYLIQGNFKQILEDVFFKLFIRIPSSLDANRSDSVIEPLKEIRGKIAVYSCIVGNYDKIVEPLYCEEGVDYLMFTDLDVPINSKWKKIDITKFPEYRTLSAKEMNRRIKMLPHVYLKEYSYSLYIDGLIEIVSAISPLALNMGTLGLGVHFHNQRDCIYDEAIMIKYAKKANMDEVKKQLDVYKKEGFPQHFGLYENTILLRNHNDERVCKLMEDWWKEYNLYPTRDQLSFPYVIWKNKFPKDKVFILGNNINRNPVFNRGLKHDT